ncbi:MAG: class I SAM-dependent methyltransferase [Gemmatimonadaceae bacterium]|nr:class I SAM-dependent methyltransferase [Gemmatimonadaceae bacterium]
MLSDPKGVRAAYASWAESYDANENRTRDLDAEVLRRHELDIAGRDVLEIGCGTGKNTEWLAQHAESVTALDFSPEMLSLARTRVNVGHVTFIEHDIQRSWPVPDESFNAVIGNLVLEHVCNIRIVFEEAQRVLRTNGTLFLCELHPFRQRLGSQAQFTDLQSGERLKVEAYVHDVSEYVNAGIDAGLRLVRIGEWSDDLDRQANSPPRLLSVLFNRS